MKEAEKEKEEEEEQEQQPAVSESMIGSKKFDDLDIHDKLKQTIKEEFKFEVIFPKFLVACSSGVFFVNRR